MELTRQQIEQMPAGREMDNAVAEHVLGHVWLHNKRYGFVRTAEEAAFLIEAGHATAGKHPNHEQGAYIGPEVGSYSNRIQDAWEIVEHLDKTARLCDVTRINGGAAYLHHCEIWNTSGEPYHRATADSAPLAICRAALLATATPAPSDAAAAQ